VVAGKKTPAPSPPAVSKIRKPKVSRHQPPAPKPKHSISKVASNKHIPPSPPKNQVLPPVLPPPSVSAKLIGSPPPRIPTPPSNIHETRIKDMTRTIDILKKNMIQLQTKITETESECTTLKQSMLEMSNKEINNRKIVVSLENNVASLTKRLEDTAKEEKRKKDINETVGAAATAAATEKSKEIKKLKTMGAEREKEHQHLKKRIYELEQELEETTDRCASPKMSSPSLLIKSGQSEFQELQIRELHETNKETETKLELSQKRVSALEKDVTQMRVAMLKQKELNEGRLQEHQRTISNLLSRRSNGRRRYRKKIIVKLVAGLNRFG
jgi:chromosome segregation ATPase